MALKRDDSQIEIGRIGCMDNRASNYDPNATIHAQQLCEYESVTGLNEYSIDKLEELAAIGEQQALGNQPLYPYDVDNNGIPVTRIDISKITSVDDRGNRMFTPAGGTGTVIPIITTTPNTDIPSSIFDLDYIDPNLVRTEIVDNTGVIVPTKSVYEVRIIGDVSANNIIKYKMNGIEEFITDGMDIIRTHTVDPLLKSAIIPYIELQRVGITPATHNVSYEITGPDTNTPIVTENDFTRTLQPGITTIKVLANKLVTTVSAGIPTVTLNVTSLQFNYLSDSYIDIPFYALNSNYITYTIGGTKRTISKTTGGNLFGVQTYGNIRIVKSDFNNGIGSYTVYVQPISHSKGSGEVKRIVINVISKEYVEGPDITNISYPSNIKGSSFSEYNVDFRIGWQSINTNYVNVYVAKYDDNYALARVEPNGTLTLNISDVLNKGRYSTGNIKGNIYFDLILVPFNTETNTKVAGIHETITIAFDKGDLKLSRNQVISDIKKAFNLSLNPSVLEAETSKYLTHYAHFGNGDNRLISNWDVDKETFSEYYTNPDTNEIRKTKEVKSLVLKLYEPLPASFQPNQQLWISKIQSFPIVEQEVLEDESSDMCTPLIPNFDIDLGDDVGYQILDDLMASGSVSSTELLNNYISQNEFSLDKLNITYTSGSDYQWDNFVKFSSATERIENFFYKVQLIEYHQAKITDLSVLPQTISITNQATREQDRINDVIRGFDAFEKHLYKVEDPLSYPGAGQTAVSASDSSEAESWYTSAKASATEFDYNNANALINNLPQHIKDDQEGQDFILFFNMIGQHFDILSSYIKGLETSKDLAHKHDTGISNDLIYHMLESLGWDADMGVKSQYLWEYAFGISKDGDEVFSWSGKRRQQEIWRRLLNNLPYFYKHKGTKRALHAAMACYGVPTSMLTILEFGGPHGDNLNTEDGTTQVTFDDRTAALSFTAGTSVEVPWHTYSETGNYPQSVEIRLQTDTPGDYVVMETDELRIEILQTTGNNAIVQFTHAWNTLPASMSIDEMYFFNDAYKHITIQHSVISGSGDHQFDLYVKEGSNERLIHDKSATMTVGAGLSTWQYGNDFTLGGNFIGNIDEFREWSVPLEEGRINNHTLMPDAIDGNHISASTTDLIYRLDFEYPKDRSLSTGDPDIINVSINQLYNEPTASAVGFPSVTTYPYQYVPYQRTVTANVPSTGMTFSNKIRFEDQTLETNLKYGQYAGVTSNGNKEDSNKLGLFFSPIKEVNMDILKSLGTFNIDNYIGDPSDVYSDKYNDLEELRDYYFQRFNLNIYEYIQLVRYIDATLFTTLESLVPARAKVTSGLLIEPHLLERSKIRHTKPTGTNPSHDTTIVVSDANTQSAEYIPIDTTLDATTDIELNSEVPIYDGLVSVDDETDVYAEHMYHFSTIVFDDKFEMIGTPLTYDATINAQYTGSLYGEYEGITFTQIGMDPNSISINGFGIYAENGHTIRTFLNANNHIVRDRKKVYKIKESYTIKTPENINPFDASEGTNYVPVTHYRYKVTFVDFDTPAPSVSGKIVEVTPLNGYFPSHYRNVGDLPTGLQNSYYNGSKQTLLTTLDGGSPVQTFTTNPNVLKVSDTGRGSGEPILIVQ